MNVLVDTGVWYAFCDPRDPTENREQVETLRDSLEFVTILLPWPVVYETIRTRLSRNKLALGRLQILLGGANILFLDDGLYRDSALQLVFDMSFRKQPPRPLSLVDCLLGLMLADANLKIDRFATFNERDFRDVCGSRAIEMIR